MIKAIAVVGLVLCVCFSAAAQPVAGMQTGDRVRVWKQDGSAVTGQVSAFGGEQIELRPDGGPSRATGARRGLAWGALLGGGAGAISLGLQHEQVGSGGSSRPKAAALGAWSGGLFGGLVGAAIGAARAREQWEPVYAPAQTREGRTPGGLHYEVSGTGDPVILIHAFSLDRRMWQPQVRALETHYRVIRYDLRGHGRSAAPTEPYTAYGDLLELVDTLDVPRATLVGLSAGAEAAINFAIAHPSRTAGLVLAAPGLGGYELPPLSWVAPVFEAAAAGDPERAAELWAETPIMTLRTNHEAAADLRGLVKDNSRLWTYRRTEQPLSPPAIQRLGEIACPVLVILGDQDLPHIMDVARLIAEGVADARLVTIAGAGHIANLDRPGPFNEAVVAFLDARRGSDGRSGAKPPRAARPDR